MDASPHPTVSPARPPAVEPREGVRSGASDGTPTGRGEARRSSGAKPVPPWVRAVGAYITVGAGSVAIVAWVMQLWRADLRIPLGYRGSDSHFYFMEVKTMLDHGWYLRNPSLGMPAGMDMRDYPLTETLHLLALKLVSLLMPDFGATVNVYFLLTFPLSALTALFVFRRYGVSSPAAAVGGLLFAFLPYHFWRGQEHLGLASYYLVPPAVLVILWVAVGDLGHQGGEEGLGPTPPWPRSRVVAGIVISLLVGMGGVYYAFFAGFFLAVGGGLASLRERRLRPMLPALGFIATILVALLVNGSANLAYLWQRGWNPEVVRVASEAELYGLKIAQLLLPVRGHRVPFLADLGEAYARRPLVNENQAATLGAVGSVGFLALIAWPAWGRRTGSHARLLEALSLLTLAGVLLATIGGFGTLFALLVSPLIRGYNRVSVYLGFFCLFAVVLWLDSLRRRLAARGVRQATFGGLLAALLAVGVLDQASPRFVPPYEVLAAEYRSDREFVRQIEAAVPAGTMIFQLPYVPFPEHFPPLHRLPDFHLVRGYLHSTTLRWSYGAMKGRPGDVWQRRMAAKPPDEMAEGLAIAGFAGIYLDRLGFPDGGRDIEERLAAKLGSAPLVSANGRLAFFTLTGLGEELRRRSSDEEWQRLRTAVLSPLGTP